MDLRLGPFDLVGPHASGGMAQVWRGVHRHSGQTVAIKVMTLAIARPLAWRVQFAREIRAVARLDHPGVVRVFDHGAIDDAVAERAGGRLSGGAPYLVMEWLDGGSIEQGPAARRWSALGPAIEALLDGLAHAHARGVVHRDLKPDNVLLAPRGPVLTDFGLAFDPQADGGEASRAVGTPGFMAPEQINNASHLFGPATDLYALGCLVWALVSGRPPHDRPGAPALALAMAHLSAPLPALEPRFAVPAGLRHWLGRMLARDPGRRFFSAAEAAAALRAWTAPGARVTADAAPIPPPTLPTDWRRPPSAAPRDMLGVGRAMLSHRAPPPVGREAARDRLWHALRALVAGGGLQTLCVAGASGQGKTHLADWLAEQAHRAGVARVLRATHDDPNGPSCGLPPMLARALGLAGRRQPDAPPSTASARRREAVDRLLPAGATPVDRAEVLAMIAADGQGAVDETRVWLRRPAEWDLAFRLMLGTLGAERPTVIVLDDLQWGPAARRTLAYLRRAARATPALIIATVRTDAGPPADEALALFDADSIIRLGALDPAAHRALLAGLLPLEPAVVDALVERAEGSPLFAAELMRHWVGADLLVEGPRGYRLAPGADEALPATIGTLWGARLEGALGSLFNAARDPLELAAVIGRVVEPDTWAEACRWAGVPWPAEAIDRLLDAGLLWELSGGRLRFAHAMLRETLQGWSRYAGRWLAWNACCARVLEARAARGEPVDDTRLAEHLIAAEELAAAVEPLARAGRRYLASSGVQHGRRQIGRRVRLLRRLGVRRHDPRWLAVLVDAARLDQRLGRYRRSSRRLERVLAQPTVVAAPLLHGRALLVYANCRYYADGPHASLPIVEASLPIIEQSGDTGQIVWHLAEYGSTAMFLGRLDDAEAALHRGLSLADADARWLHGTLWYYLANAAAFRGQHDAALAHCQQARAAFGQAGMQHNVSLTWAVEGDLHRRAGRLHQAEAAYAEHAARMRLVGPAERVYLFVNRAMMALARADWPAALADIERAEAEQISTPRAALAVARLHAYAGQADWLMWDAVAGTMAELLARAPVSPDVPWAADRAAALAEAAGRSQRAAFARQLAADHRRRLCAVPAAAQLP